MVAEAAVQCGDLTALLTVLSELHSAEPSIHAGQLTTFDSDHCPELLTAEPLLPLDAGTVFRSVYV